MTEAMPFLQKYDITFLRPPTIQPGAMLLYVAENSQSTLTTIFGILAISCAAMAVRISSGTM